MRNVEDLEGEVWVKHPIGIKVSNMGRVETRNKGKHYGCQGSKPYLLVRWKEKHYQVHRLICEVFNENSNNLPCVNHKDENPRNNRADNLEWCTYSYNNTYGTAIERRVKNTDYKAKVAHTDYKAFQAKRIEKLQKPILQLNKNMEVVREWSSAKQASIEGGGFNQGHITSCCKGNRKTCGGYIWQYKNN